MNVENYMLSGAGPYDNHTQEGKCSCGGDMETIDWCKARNKSCQDSQCGVLDDDIPDCNELVEKEVCDKCGRRL